MKSCEIRQEIRDSNIYVINWKNGRKLVLFYILNNVSEHVTFVQLMDSLGNVNHAVIVVGKWTFYSKKEKAFPLTIE